MKKIIFIAAACLFLFTVDPTTITLKDKVYAQNNIIKLNDIIQPHNAPIPNITISKIDDFPYRLKSKTIIKRLFANDIYNITIIGDSVEIYPDKTLTPDYSLTNPVAFLTDYLTSYIDNENFTIKVNVQRIDPPVTLDSVYRDFKWELTKISSSINELANTKTLPLYIGDNYHLVSIDVEIYTDIWIAKKNFRAGDYVTAHDFIKKHVDITLYNETGTLVYDLNRALNSRVNNTITIGEVLKWDFLERAPLLEKGEPTKLIVTNRAIEVIIPCNTLEQGFENEKIKVKLTNGKVKFGIVKNNEGFKYVESL